MQGHNTQLINVEIKQFYFQSYTLYIVKINITI